jgi:hypothetical protein
MHISALCRKRDMLSPYESACSSSIYQCVLAEDTGVWLYYSIQGGRYFKKWLIRLGSTYPIKWTTCITQPLVLAAT